MIGALPAPVPFGTHSHLQASITTSSTLGLENERVWGVLRQTDTFPASRGPQSAVTVTRIRIRVTFFSHFHNRKRNSRTLRILRTPTPTVAIPTGSRQDKVDWIQDRKHSAITDVLQPVFAVARTPTHPTHRLYRGTVWKWSQNTPLPHRSVFSLLPRMIPYTIDPRPSLPNGYVTSYCAIALYGTDLQHSRARLFYLVFTLFLSWMTFSLQF